MAEELDQTLIDAAKQPAHVSGDEGSITMRTPDEIIAADKHLAAKQAAKSRRNPAGLRFTRISSPGTVH